MATASKRQKTTAGEAEEAAESINLKGYFSKDLSSLMYAFGDDVKSRPDTLDLVEDIVIEYSSGVLRRAMDLATLRGKTKPPLKGTGSVTAEDVLAVVRKDPKKADRVKELFLLQRTIDQARSVAADVEKAGQIDMDKLKTLADFTAEEENE